MEPTKSWDANQPARAKKMAVAPRQYLSLTCLLVVIVCLSIYNSIGTSNYFSEMSSFSRVSAVHTSPPEMSKEVTGIVSQVLPWVFFVLLSLQAGCHPLLVKKFMPTTIVSSSAVFATEIAKLIISSSYLLFSGEWMASTREWTLKSAVIAAGIPASLFGKSHFFEQSMSLSCKGWN